MERCKDNQNNLTCCKKPRFKKDKIKLKIKNNV